MAITSRVFNGAHLRALRTQKEWSQGELGRRIGAHTTSISDWERGSNAPSGRHVVGLCREFGVAVEEFYGDDEDAEVARMRAAVPLTHEELDLLGTLMGRLINGRTPEAQRERDEARA